MIACNRSISYDKHFEKKSCYQNGQFRTIYRLFLLTPFILNYILLRMLQQAIMKCSFVCVVRFALNALEKFDRFFCRHIFHYIWFV